MSKSPDQKACHEHVRKPQSYMFLLLRIFCLPNENGDYAAGQQPEMRIGPRTKMSLGAAFLRPQTAFYPLTVKMMLQGSNLTDEYGPKITNEPRRSFPEAQNSFLLLESGDHAAG